MNKHINFDNIRLMYGCPIVDWKEIDKVVAVKNEEEEEFKPRYSLYKYISDGKLSMYTLAENDERLFSEQIASYDHSSIWEALNKAREIALSKSTIDETKTKLEVNPDLQFIIIEEYAPGKSKIKCIVSQEEIMHEKFHYKNLTNPEF